MFVNLHHLVYVYI